MADYTIALEEQGEYELPIAADAVVTVDVESDSALRTQVQIIVHSGTRPVYAKRGATVAPREKGAIVIPPMTIAEIPLGVDPVETVALSSNADAVVSVTRA